MAGTPISNRPAAASRTYKPASWGTPRRADATTANYPALKHFFVADRRDPADYGLLDVAQNVAFAVNGWTPAGLGIVSEYTNDTDGHNLALSAGSWDIETDKETLVFIGGKFSSAFAYGFGSSLTQEEILLSSGVYLVTVLSGATTVATPAASAASPTNFVILGAVIKPGDEMVGFYTTPTGEYVQQAAVSLAGLPALPTIPDTGSIGGNNSTTSLYGLGIMQFAKAPGVSRGIEWMHREWRQGNVALPAGWQGIS